MFVGSSLIVVTIECNCKKMVSSQLQENQWLEVTPCAKEGGPLAPSLLVSEWAGQISCSIEGDGPSAPPDLLVGLSGGANTASELRVLQKKR